jgi:hypothetical protein
MGEHLHGVPHGMATVYQYPYYIHDGLFRYGVPDGLGVRLDFRLGNKFVYGKFASNDISIGKDKTQTNSKYYNINEFRLDSNYSTIKPSISLTQTPTKKYKSIILS